MCWGRDYAFISTGSKEFIVLFKINTQSDLIEGDLLRILAADIKRIETTYKSQHGNSSEIGWDMINLVEYRVLMTYYYMPFFNMVWVFLLQFRYTVQKNLKVASWGVQPHRLLSSGLQISLALPHHTENRQPMVQPVLPGLYRDPNFLRVP